LLDSVTAFRAPSILISSIHFLLRSENWIGPINHANGRCVFENTLPVNDSAIVIKPGQAEVAFAVVDQFQGQGIGSALLRRLSSRAREAGLQEFVAEVLPEKQC
jgi:GNAT superfamily N-acetyltransferase